MVFTTPPPFTDTDKSSAICLSDSSINKLLDKGISEFESNVTIFPLVIQLKTDKLNAYKYITYLKKCRLEKLRPQTNDVYSSIEERYFKCDTLIEEIKVVVTEELRKTSVSLIILISTPSSPQQEITLLETDFLRTESSKEISLTPIMSCVGSLKNFMS